MSETGLNWGVMSTSFKVSWTTIDDTPDPSSFVRFMDRFRDEDYPMLERLGIGAGQRILDVGCGTGEVARAAAQRVGDSGFVVAVDNSRTMVVEARSRDHEAGTAVSYHVGDAERLSYVGESFDCCFARHLFEVVSRPSAVMSELARVTRRGGRVAVSAPDMGATLLDVGDRALTRRIFDFICDNEVNGWVGRQLPRLFHEAGLRDLIVRPMIALGDFDSYCSIWLDGYLNNAQEAGVVTPAEVETWLTEIRTRPEGGPLCFTTGGFYVQGTKP